MIKKMMTTPCSLNNEPYLTEWHHEMEDGSVHIWVQCNEVVDDNAKPQWVRLGDILEKEWLKYGYISGEGCDPWRLDEYTYIKFLENQYEDI